MNPYTYTGDHPWGFELYDHPIRGRCRRFAGHFRGLTTEELDALEEYAFAEDCARERDVHVEAGNQSLIFTRMW